MWRYCRWSRRKVKAVCSTLAGQWYRCSSRRLVIWETLAEILTSGISSNLTTSRSVRSNTALGSPDSIKRWSSCSSWALDVTCWRSFSNVHSWLRLISRSLFSLTSERNTPNRLEYNWSYWSTMCRRNAKSFLTSGISLKLLSSLTFSKEYSLSGLLKSQ